MFNPFKKTTPNPFEHFEAAFKKTRARQPDTPLPVDVSREAADFLRRYSGCVFNQGLYRIFESSLREDIHESVSIAFPEWADQVLLLGSDWMGRVLALSLAENTILLFEPGAGEVRDSGIPLGRFHNLVLPDTQAEALAPTFFGLWLSQGGSEPGYRECVGYRIPLFLGGSDDLANLEIGDLSVYWFITAQLVAATRNIPIGGSIGHITLQNPDR